jgi:hypothetical protein
MEGLFRKFMLDGFDDEMRGVLQVYSRRRFTLFGFVCSVAKKGFDMQLWTVPERWRFHRFHKCAGNGTQVAALPEGFLRLRGLIKG